MFAAPDIRCIYTEMPELTQAAQVISEECFCTRVRQVARAVTKIYDDALRPTGLQTSQLMVLVAVARFGERGAAINALADVLVMDRTTLTRNLRPLERVGLLRVGRAADDARVRVVKLTGAGERSIEKAYPAWEQAQRLVRELVGAGDADRLHAGASRALGLIVPSAHSPDRGGRPPRGAGGRRAPARRRTRGAR